MGAEMLAPANLTGAFHPAEKKGYSGVGLYFRRRPTQIRAGLGLPDIDFEGRFLRADFDQLSVISVYLPSGSSGPERQVAMFAFMKAILPKLKSIFYTTSEKLTPIQSHTARSKGRGTTLTVTLDGGAVEQLC